jgi:exo-beta-1,3-glucanase (GH17 family)
LAQITTVVKKKGGKKEDSQKLKVINIEKKPSTFNDFTRFINHGFQNFSPKHNNEQRTVRSEVSTNSDCSLLASKTGVYRTYSSFDLCQIEEIEKANSDPEEDLP